MSKCVNLYVPALCAGLLASVMVPFAGARAQDCLTEPSRAAAPGSHWAYRVDRTTDRKCWYLVGAGMRPPSAEQTPAPDPAPHTFGSLFSWWSSGASGTPAASPDNAPPDARAIGESKPRTPHRMDAQAAPQAALAPKPHRPATHAPTAHEHAPLTDEERDALFEDFLHWKDTQKPQ